MYGNGKTFDFKRVIKMNSLERGNKEIKRQRWLRLNSGADPGGGRVSAGLQPSQCLSSEQLRRWTPGTPGGHSAGVSQAACRSLHPVGASGWRQPGLGTRGTQPGPLSAPGRGSFLEPGGISSRTGRIVELLLCEAFAGLGGCRAETGGAAPLKSKV